VLHEKNSKMGTAETVLKAGMGGTEIDETATSELGDVTHALVFGGVNDGPTIGGNSERTVDFVLGGMSAHRRKNWAVAREKLNGRMLFGMGTIMGELRSFQKLNGRILNGWR
jgi:hypothetical protein